MNMREATLNGSILRVAYFCKVKKFALFCKVLIAYVILILGSTVRFLSTIQYN